MQCLCCCCCCCSRASTTASSAAATAAPCATTTAPLTAANSARLEAEEIAEVEEVFDDLDIDGDGKLSQDEIEAAVHQVLEREYEQNDHTVMDQKNAITQEVMNELDIDGDGIVTKEEFQQAALREKEKRCDHQTC